MASELRISGALARHPAVRGLVWFAVWMVFGLALVQAISVTVDWSQGRLTRVGPWEGLWLALLPVLIFIYFRFFSMFHPGCRACLPPGGGSEHGPRGP